MSRSQVLSLTSELLLIWIVSFAIYALFLFSFGPNISLYIAAINYSGSFVVTVLPTSLIYELLKFRAKDLSITFNRYFLGATIVGIFIYILSLAFLLPKQYLLVGILEEYVGWLKFLILPSAWLLLFFFIEEKRRKLSLNLDSHPSNFQTKPSSNKQLLNPFIKVIQILFFITVFWNIIWVGIYSPICSMLRLEPTYGCLAWRFDVFFTLLFDLILTLINGVYLLQQAKSYPKWLRTFLRVLSLPLWAFLCDWLFKTNLFVGDTIVIPLIGLLLTDITQIYILRKYFKWRV